MNCIHRMSSGNQMFPYWLGTYTVNPKSQFGLVSLGTGNNGNGTITLSTPYVNVSYSILATHQGTTAGANIAVSTLSQSTFQLYWTNAGGGIQQFYFQTLGNV